MEINEQTAPVESTAPEQEAPKLTDLDGISEFTFQGEKYNPERLHSIFSEHKTWSEKIKEFENEKKFQDNLQIDLNSVLEKPSLAAEFKATYPKRFHWVLDQFLEQRQPTANSQTAQPQTQQPQLPKEFLEKINAHDERLRRFEERAFKAEVDAANAKIDSIMPELIKKYPLANEDQVYMRMEKLLQSDPDYRLNDKTWERLVRESHESFSKKADQFYGAKLKSQMEKGQRGQDTGPGGSTPGQAPVKPRTFDEAREEMIKSLTRTG